MQQKKIKELIDQIWPKTKQELEKGLVQTKKFLSEGEKHLRNFSHESAINVHKMSLQIQRERAYYELGKAVAKIKKESWPGDKKVGIILANIRRIERDMKKTK